MKKTIIPQDQAYWYLHRPVTPSLRESLDADVIIVGGGMAGLSAAQAFINKKRALFYWKHIIAVLVPVEKVLDLLRPTVKFHCHHLLRCMAAQVVMQYGR